MLEAGLFLTFSGSDRCLVGMEDLNIPSFVRLIAIEVAAVAQLGRAADFDRMVIKGRGC